MHSDSPSSSAAQCDSKTAIFVVSHSSPGGTQELWANLAQAFRNRGFHVQLMALYPVAAKQDTRSDLPWNYFVKERPTTVGCLFVLIRALLRFFRHETPDAVFTAMPAANIIVPLMARFAGATTKIIISHHIPGGSNSLLLNFADGLSGSLRNVKTIVGVSDTVGKSLVHRPRPYRRKQMTIHNALPPDIEAHLASLAAGRNRTNAKDRVVVAIGRLAPEKNYQILLRASVHMPDVTVRIVGAGPEDGYLRGLAGELGVANRVEFLGHRSRREALSLLSDGDVFAQPSFVEGHSLALIEAAKLGMPLVVSTVPVQLEGITAADGVLCGIAVDPYDDMALARAVLRLMDCAKQYQVFAAKARHLGLSSGFDAMIADYLRLVA